MRLWLIIGMFGALITSSKAQHVEVVGSIAWETCLAEQPFTDLDSSLLACAQRLRTQGFLEAAVDNIEPNTDGDTLLVYTHLGPRYQLGQWSNRVNESTLFGPVTSDTAALPKRIDQLPGIANDYLDARAREGYPFARVRFDSLRLADSLLSGQTTVWSGPPITFGGVRFGLDEEPPVSPGFLTRYLRLEPGSAFRQNQVRLAEQRLRALRFLTIGRPPVIVYESNQAFLYVDAKPRKTSRFDFLVGFLPNSPNNNGQLLLTGDVTLNLENTLRKGERLFFSFERLQPEATEVELEASYPFVLESPFGATAKFGLYRQQDDWLRLNYEVGASYSLGGSDAYELFYEGGVAQVLGIDTQQVVQTQRLPNVLDATRNGFGMRLLLDRRDDVFDTRSGWALSLAGSASLRDVTVPTGIQNLGEELGKQADSLAGRTGQYRLVLDVQRFFALGKRSTVFLQVRGASIIGSQNVLRNELYRIGGNRLLRGFDEQSIDAQHYGIATAEWRLLLGGGSYLFAFADQGILVDPYRVGRDVDQPTGFGGGLRLATRGGALSLTYALGRRSDAPLDVERAKVHVGYVSRF